MVLKNQFKYHVILWWVDESHEHHGDAPGETWLEAWEWLGQCVNRLIIKCSEGRARKERPSSINIELEDRK